MGIRDIVWPTSLYAETKVYVKKYTFSWILLLLLKFLLFLCLNGLFYFGTFY